MFKTIIKIFKKINFIPWLIIPKGDYCYKYKKIYFKQKQKRLFPEIKICRYWCWDKRYPAKSVGYCKYLKVSDNDENGIGHLWDMVKECGINEFKEDKK